MRMQLCLLTVLFLIGNVRDMAAGEWSQFRGPNNSGLSDASQLPTEWSGEKNIRWKVAVPGAAWSCPIVWGDKIFLTTAITEKQEKPKPGMGGGGFGGGRRGREGGGFREGGGNGEGYGPPGRGDGDGPDRKTGSPDKAGTPDKSGPSEKKSGEKQSEASKDGEPRRGGSDRGGFRRGGGMGGRGFGGRGTPPDVVYRWEIHCLDRLSGNTLWHKVALERKPTIPVHRTNTFASETPITDGARVYAYFGMHGLYCYDMEGKELWKKDLGSYPMQFGWGTGSSPALDGDRLFVQCDNEKESFLAAFDKHKGEELWRVKRDARSTWSTPFIWHNKGRTEIIACGGERVRSYDPADGKILWELTGLQGSCSATPVADEEMLYVGCGGGMGSSGPLFAVKFGATGDISLKEGETTNANIVWSRTKAGPPMASPLLYQGRLYVLEQRGGSVSCYDARTGEPHYFRKRLQGAGGFTSSPWAADGKVFCLDDSGKTFVLKAGSEFTVIGENKLEEMCWSTPALTADAVLLRGIDHLYCIKK